MARKKKRKKKSYIIGFEYDPEGDASDVRLMPITSKVHKTIQAHPQVKRGREYLR